MNGPAHKQMRSAQARPPNHPRSLRGPGKHHALQRAQSTSPDAYPTIQRGQLNHPSGCPPAESRLVATHKRLRRLQSLFLGHAS
jgi:hypothetical protein